MEERGAGNMRKEGNEHTYINLDEIKRDESTNKNRKWKKYSSLFRDFELFENQLIYA